MNTFELNLQPAAKELFTSKKPWRYAILMGGRGFGRSGAARRHSIIEMMSKPYVRGAFMRQVGSTIRTSCFQEMKDQINEIKEKTGSDQGFIVKDGVMEIVYGTNFLRAHGFKASDGDLTARLKSLAGYNYIWIEEAEEISEDEFMKLDDSLRTVKGDIRIIFTLNTPPKNHWIIKRWFDLQPSGVEGFYKTSLKPEVSHNTIYIPGTWEDNKKNIDQATAERYEGYRTTKPSYYWHMIRGLCPEVLTGRIYGNWEIIDSVPHQARLLGRGLDFGFDPDPAAVVDVYFYNGGYILDERVYQKNLLNSHLLATISSYPTAPTIADSAEPKSIAELRAGGLMILEAKKGPDSVRAGIKAVQGMQISVTRRSVNLINEYENYAWKMNKDGDSVGIPNPSCADHLLDAARYALTTLAKTDLDAIDKQKRHMAAGPKRIQTNSSR